MKKKRSVLFTVVVDLLFLAAIAVVGWKIYDYVKDGRQTKEVADELWAQAVITAAPETTAGSPATTPEPETETSPEAAAESPAATPEPETETSSEATAESPAAKTEHGTDAASESGMQAALEAEAANSSEPGAENATADTPALETERITAAANGPTDEPAPVPSPTPRFTDAPEIPAGMNFDGLAEVNREVAAWLYQPETDMNQPVVHRGDNEYYLTHGFRGDKQKSGTLFIDARNAGDFSDRNTIIYGHARKDMLMFGKLHNYKDAAYCEAHPFLYLYVPGHRYRLEIVATGDTQDASEYYALPAGDQWYDLLQRMMDRSPWDFGIPVSTEDHYVTLSTCAYDYQDERWLVIARIDDPEGTLGDFPVY